MLTRALHNKEEVTEQDPMDRLPPTAVRVGKLCGRTQRLEEFLAKIELPAGARHSAAAPAGL